MNQASTTAAIDSRAPTKNAACTPAAIPGTEVLPAADVAAAIVYTTMNNAVPAAPASCWLVPSTAEPCEY